LNRSAPSPMVSGAADVVAHDLDDVCTRAADVFRALSGRSVLITGGAGFLGHYLVQAPLHWNHHFRGSAEPIRITVCDNGLRGFPRWLEEWRSDRYLKIAEHDVTQPVPAALADCQVIIHAASIASPIFYRKHPLETMDANVTGVRRLLDLCLERADRGEPVEGMLFFSSSEIYGDPDASNIPTSEEYRGNVSCTGPRACYDESKRYGETLCVNFARVHDIPVKIVRPFNNYGPGLKLGDRRVVPDFARDILAGRDIVLLSDGSPSRTFCYVTDAVVGYLQALVRGRNGESYNIGVETPETSMSELAKRMIRIASDLFGYTGSVRREGSGDPDYLTDNPVRRCPDITKARDELGYEPSVELDDGLERSLRWYAGNRTGDET
jgi:UDP-glucuronate decarboxylase